MIRTIDTEHGKFTDLINDEGEVLKTAEEVYQEHLDNFDFINGEWIPKQIDNCLEEIKTNQQLTEELKISQQQVADLEIELILIK